MAGTALRVLFDAARLPAVNMALDEALLRTAGPPTVRFYAWSPPGLSIGRFQEPGWFADVRGPHHLVRRATGGGAIYHDQELTFCLTAAATLLPADVAASYAVVHAAWQRALRACGVATTLVRGAGPAGRPRPESRWCFAAPADLDLVLDATGGKLLGSAQRRIRQPSPRLLHHGSLLLRPPPQPAGCTALVDVVDPDAAVGVLKRAFATELGTALGLRPDFGGTLTAAEGERAAELTADYCHPGPLRRSSR